MNVPERTVPASPSAASCGTARDGRRSPCPRGRRAAPPRAPRARAAPAAGSRGRVESGGALPADDNGRVKIGIVVPYSWSFWGAVVEHAELQSEALRRLGHEVKTIMGNDPPGQFTRTLHPRHGRDGPPPPDIIPIGRSVIVPANGSLPNIILSPRSLFRIRAALAREKFDVLAPARADDADAVHRRARDVHRADGRNVPRERRPRVDAHRAARLGVPRRSPRPAHRRLESRRVPRRSAGSRASTRSSRTACSSRLPPNAGGRASTASSSQAGTNSAKGCTCCSARGPRSGAAQVQICT